MKKVRVLSIDGGGIRGIIPATILDYIEHKLIEITNNPNARIADFFDIIVGTSTGGILGCFYLTPNSETDDNGPNSKYHAGQALEFYSKNGFDIFNKSKRSNWFGLRQLFNSTRYSPKNLEKILQEKFGELKMKDLLKPCIVTTYDLINKTSFFFNSRETKNREFFLKDVVRSTSAAPTYFPPAKISNLKNISEKMINIDGGVFANNPTMCAYVECRKTIFQQMPEPPSAKDMLILSLGTGGGQFDLPNENNSTRWNVIKWAKSIPEIMMDGSIDTVHYQMKQLYSTLDKKQEQLNYKRIDVPLDKRKYAKDMADASSKNIEALKKAGEAALNSALIESNEVYGLDKFIHLLIENAPNKN